MNRETIELHMSVPHAPCLVHNRGLEFWTAGCSQNLLVRRQDRQSSDIIHRDIGAVGLAWRGCQSLCCGLPRDVVTADEVGCLPPLSIYLQLFSLLIKAPGTSCLLGCFACEVSSRFTMQNSPSTRPCVWTPFCASLDSIDRRRVRFGEYGR